MVNIVSKPTQGRNKVVVIGNGKVGLRFCEQMVELDQKQNYELIVFSEEKIPAYDRRAIALYSKHQNQEELLLAPRVWYEKHGIELHLSDRILKIDRTAKQVISSRGEVIDYDHVVLATGSYSFVPPIADIEHPGVHLYRTIDDMERILADVAQCKSVAVIGGGLFGLEAARAVYELGLKTHIVESAPWLMQHQLDVIGATCLKEFIEARGVEVHLGKETTKILHAGERVCGLQFMDNSQLQVDMVIFAAGIRPRDELGRICQLGIHANGGIVVNNHLQTSDPSIFAIGKAAWHPDMMCGLVSP
ncbi:MAG: NAD(P)/FAD-dependent oxidoreductase, partial [Planctomycetaceae bacterium]|nr:NAD(P)/FAD-dependent oxidoreductase [Planctomycetaceae bacterium]